jgi:hypothetical protein
MSAFSYFFDIQTSMPTMKDFAANDPVRALAQIIVTAPFYAGIGYSLGALAAKRTLLKRLFGSTRDLQE